MILEKELACWENEGGYVSLGGEISAMKKLPANITTYKRTPTFTEGTVPEGLLNNHNTKTGVWGLIQIEKGELEYTIENQKTYVLTKDKHGVVEPEILHRIKPLGKVSFSIEFYK